MSERLIFGLLIIVGYFLVGAFGGLSTLNEQQHGTIRDVMLTVGPILGMIAQSIWKNDKVETQRSDTINALANRSQPIPVSGPMTFEARATYEATQSNTPEPLPLDDGGAPVGGASWRASKTQK